MSKQSLHNFRTNIDPLIADRQRLQLELQGAGPIALFPILSEGAVRNLRTSFTLEWVNSFEASDLGKLCRLSLGAYFW